MSNRVLTPDNSVETPMGTIYAVPMHGKEYPGIYVYLKQGNADLLLSVVECVNNSFSNEEPYVACFAYHEIAQDEPCDEGYVYQEDIDAWKKECNL